MGLHQVEEEEERPRREAVQEELWTILFDPECKDGLATVLGNVQRNAEGAAAVLLLALALTQSRTGLTAATAGALLALVVSVSST